MNTDTYLQHLAGDSERFASMLETSSASEPIAACPGWDVLRLAEHLGQIHRWAAFCVSNDRPPTADDSAALESFEADRAADWLREGAGRLIEVLSGIDAGSPPWNPFPVERTATVWPRRQAHETAIHRWDAERAVGVEARIDAELASDGIDEYFELAVPRLVERRGLELPTGSLHVHCTDVNGEWLVWTDETGYRMIREHQKGDGALRGPAEPILLELWGRETGRADELDTVGDEQVLADWLSIAGM